jgi:hypothetical protein
MQRSQRQALSTSSRSNMPLIKHAISHQLLGPQAPVQHTTVALLLHQRQLRQGTTQLEGKKLTKPTGTA